MCYHVEFGRSASNSVNIDISESPKLVSAGACPVETGACWPITSIPLHSGLPRRLGRCWSNASSVRSTMKSWPLASHLSKSLKVIGTDTDRSDTCDFLLTFHSNRLVPFPRCSKILAENCEFPPLNAYLLPRRGFPLEFCNSGWVKKPEWLGTWPKNCCNL